MRALRTGVALAALPALLALGSAAAVAQPTPAAGTPVPIGPSGSSRNDDPNGYQTFRQSLETIAVGDYLIHPKISNEFSPSNHGRQSFRALGEHELTLHNLQLLIGAEYRSYSYPHNQSVPNVRGACPGDIGCVTNVGRIGQTFVPKSVITDEQYDGRLGIKLLDPRVYLGVSYLEKYNSAGYPRVRGLGLGLEKLPDKESPVSVYFSTYYYPNLTGAYRASGGAPGSLGLTYRMFRYDGGLAIAPGRSPIFINAGLLGDRTTARNSAPSNESHISPYVGVGFHLH
ncbi:MAG: hypothetical protein NVS3B16_18630 [Vulcanimicrobiaceae bacterium]